MTDRAAIFLKRGVPNGTQHPLNGKEAQNYLDRLTDLIADAGGPDLTPEETVTALKLGITSAVLCDPYFPMSEGALRGEDHTPIYNVAVTIAALLHLTFDPRPN